MSNEYPIMLFDGECAMCNGAVQFVLDHEREAQFRFAPLQSDIGREYLEQFHLPVDNFDSYVVIDHGVAHVKSRAVVKMGFYMGGPWQALSYLVLCSPKFIADAIYSYGFNNRLKWFGKNTQCRLLPPEQSLRFLELGDSSFKALE